VGFKKKLNAHIWLASARDGSSRGWQIVFKFRRALDQDALYPVFNS
jgi:hypothetical protein